MKRSVTYVLSFFILTYVSCKSAEDEKSLQSNTDSFKLDVPVGFPQPDIPEDNPLTVKKIALGKKLFFDPILSLDSSVSCGSCHFQKYAFSDTVAISSGVHGQTGNRNAPPLFNLAWRSAFFHDGGVPTLEMQVIAPIQTEEEMHLNILDAAERLKNHPEYPALIAEVFEGREADAFVITRAIAAFERTLVSGNSPYDQYKYLGNSAALNADAVKGLALFESDRLNCSQCHSGFNFTTEELINNGLYSNYERDAGRMRISLNKSDEGKFKVPSLRNVALTGPYMHDGSFNTLEEVIDHYASGGSNHFNKSPLIKGFDLSADEKNHLLAFLNSLTDRDFITNENYYQ